MTRTWSALGLFGVGRGMRSFKETPQEELELEVLAADLELQHRRKVQAAGYRLPFDISAWWREQLNSFRDNSRPETERLGEIESAGGAFNRLGTSG